MAKYLVTVLIDASASVEVEASSKEKAIEKAIDEVEVPSLCWACAGNIELGDVMEIETKKAALAYLDPPNGEQTDGTV